MIRDVNSTASGNAGAGGAGGAISTLEFWTIREVANLLRVDGSTVRRWCEAGRIKAQKIGNAWRVHSTVVDEVRRNGVADTPSAVPHDPAWDAPDQFAEEPAARASRANRVKSCRTRSRW